MNKLKQEFKKLLRDNRAQADGASTLYMLIIVAIVGIVLIALIKPMFNKSMKYQQNVASLPNQGVATNNNTVANTPATSTQ